MPFLCGRHSGARLWATKPNLHSVINKFFAIRAVACVASLFASSVVFGQGAPNIVWSGPGHTGINGLAVSPDGQTLATASLGDETIKLWNAAEGKLLHTLAGHYGGVLSAAFTPDGTMVATAGEQVPGSGSAGVKLWRVSDGAFLRDFTAPISSIAFSVAISPDGQFLAAGDQSQIVNL